jgi:hypothetical protein
MIYQYNNKLDELNGLLVKHIDCDDEQLIIEVEDGRRFSFCHEQDCCESVSVYSVDGNLKELQGKKLVRIDCDNVDPDDYVLGEHVDSYTFTNVRFITDEQTSLVRWFGESNGYYGEGISFSELS